MWVTWYTYYTCFIHVLYVLYVEKVGNHSQRQFAQPCSWANTRACPRVRDWRVDAGGELLSDHRPIILSLGGGERVIRRRIEVSKRLPKWAVTKLTLIGWELGHLRPLGPLFLRALERKSFSPDS